MNPIVASAMFGLMKGIGAARHSAQPSAPSSMLHFIGPLWEEVVYRAVPLGLGGSRLPRGITALPFAVDHIIGESKLGLSGAAAAARFADVFLGGLLYEGAYRRYGLLGSTLAHCLHNIGCSVGRYAAKNRGAP